MAQLDPFKVINYDTFDFQNSAIIKPKSENFDETHRIPTKTTSVIINSADRKKEAYGTPSDYVAELYEEIQDVISVELKFASLPYNPYNITAANNMISINSTIYSIKAGQYEGASLAQALAQLNPVVGWSVSYDNITKHLVFTANEAFTINGSSTYQKGSALKTLGFKSTSQTAMLNPTSGMYEVESVYAIDLEPNNTVIMNIDTMQVKVSNNNIFNKAFGILPQNLSKIRTADTYTVKKTFNPPLARLDKMRIRFQDIDGNPYDFQNRDHILEFSVDSHKNIRKYQAYT